MTYEEACLLLGHEKPPKLGATSRELVVKFVLRLTGNGTREIA